MSQIDEIVYTARTHTTCGRDGAARSADGRLDIRLSLPGSTGQGTNPEQLFAAGWSACFIDAMGIGARAAGVTLPADIAVDAEVDLGTGEGGYLLQARLAARLPGTDPETARAIVDRHVPDLSQFQGHSRKHRRGHQLRLTIAPRPGRPVRARSDGEDPMSVSLSSALPFHTVPFVAAVIAGLSTFATIAVMLPASAMFLGWVAFNMASPSFATGWPITAAFRSGSHSASARR